MKARGRGAETVDVSHHANVLTTSNEYGSRGLLVAVRESLESPAHPHAVRTQRGVGVSAEDTDTGVGLLIGRAYRILVIIWSSSDVEMSVIR